MKFDVSVIRVDRFVSKKGTNCAWVWISIPKNPMPFKILVYVDDQISKAETCCNQNLPITLKIGSGSDLVARLEIA